MLHLEFKKQVNKLFRLFFVCLILMLLPLSLSADNGFFRFKVNKELGETVSIYIYTIEGMKDAKVNITGVENMDNFKSGKKIDYTLTSQEVTITGDIENIYIDNNNVTEAEATNFTTLRKIECYENEMTSLNITGCPNIYWIDCSKNLLTDLKLSNIEKLKTLLCEHNRLKSIDIVNCPLLWSFGIEDNLLDEKEMVKLVNSLGDRSEMNDYGSLYVENKECSNHNYFNKVLSAILEGKKWKAYENVNDQWKRFYGENVSDAVILYAKKFIDDEITLNITAEGNVSFNGIKNGDDFVNGKDVTYTLSSPVVIVRGDVAKLAVNNMDITLVDATSNATLQELNCDENQIQVLNLAGCDKLTSLRCSANELMELDLTGVKALKDLDCSNNYLTNLDLSGNADLIKLDCTNNVLSSINLKNCKNLNEVSCSSNQLRWSSFNSIVNDIPDFSGAADKGNIYVYNKQAGNDERNRIDSEQVAKLVGKGWNVFCFDNSEWKSYEGETVMGPSKITIENGLNVGDMVAYGFLAMGEIKVTGVAEPEKALSGTVEFYTLTDKTVTIEGDVTLLDCSMNDQTSIKLENCQMLETLNCYDNLLTSIRFDNCPNIKEIHCYNNCLDATAMTNMISDLPARAAADEAMIDVYDDVSGYDKNECLESHVAEFYAKNWTPYYHEQGTFEWVAYENTHVGIENMLSDEVKPSVKNEGNIITVSGLPASVIVRLMAIDGTCVNEFTTDEDGTVRIVKDNIPGGVYMINTACGSVKIIIK